LKVSLGALAAAERQPVGRAGLEGGIRTGSVAHRGGCPITQSMQLCGRCRAWRSHAAALGTFNHTVGASCDRLMPGRSARLVVGATASCSRLMPGRSARLVVGATASCRSRMPGRLACLAIGTHPWSPGGRSSALPACPAQPGIPADRFAREIVGFLEARCGALAAAECQSVGRAS